MHKKFVIICGAILIFAILFWGWSTLVNAAYRAIQSTGESTTLPPKASDIIEKLLSQKVSLECSYLNESGEQTLAFVKNGNVKAQTSISGQKTNVIYKDSVIYVWGGKEGMKARVTTDLINKLEKKVDMDFIKILSNYETYCKEANISDGGFTLPSEVSFKDYTGLINLLP